MSDAATFRIDRDASANAGLASLFAGVDGMARALAAVVGGGFAIGVAIVLIAAAG